MIVEKLDWVRHAGLQIFSLDIQPDGSRFATAGGDHKVRIWSMSALQILAEGDSQTKLLATLRDHFGSVNCVRWSQAGHLIASGSDDQLVIVHKRHPGSGTTEFGSGEPPDTENWKNILTLRGHTADVVDLAWSPDDSMIASCSLDNTVRIWSGVNGSSISVLHGHQSLVKGVAWDPIGSFLASQSDDKSVIIWHTGKWNAINRAEGPWEKTVGSTFFRRLGWSPCGHFITSTHGYQDPSHTAPVLERGDWGTSFDFVGHNAPVVAVRYNYSMFRKISSNESRGLSQDNHVSSTKESSGTDDPPYNVIAMGSQDCNITVWTTASPRPVFVGKHFFSQSVVDLSWSTDGYTLLCCSLDGTVASFSFESKELGQKLSKEEMEEFRKVRYGDVQARRLILVESPALLALEAAGVKQLENSSAIPEIQQSVREMSLEGPTGPPAADRRTQVIQQTEYRGADGRRRIIPKPLVQDLEQNDGPSGVTIENFPNSSGPKFSLHSASDPGAKAGLADGGNLVRERTNRGSQSSGLQGSGQDPSPPPTNVGNSISANGKHAPELLVEPPFNHGGVLSIQIESVDDPPCCLEARPAEVLQKGGYAGDPHPVGDYSDTDIVCTLGGNVLWWDRLKRRATVLAGNANVWVVACDDNSIQVYSRAGRRALPPIIMSSPTAFMDCDKAWKLLLLSCCGALHIWDLHNSISIFRESISAVLSSFPASGSEKRARVISARLSEAGAPLIVLENRHVFLFHLGMQCWLRVANSPPSSQFCKHSPMLTTILEEKHTKPKKVGSLGPDGTFNLARAGLTLNNASFTRGQLESEMAIAVALEASEEYRRCLLAYTRCLTREEDKSRLRELCEELLGPRRPFQNGENGRSLEAWSPLVLGMRKRDLLKNDVLPAMASNRSIQRLLAEFADLLVETEIIVAQSGPAQ